MGPARLMKMLPIECRAISPQVRHSNIPFWVLMATLWVGGLVVYFNAMTNADVAWFLTGTSKLLNGEKLYRDVVEVNPPLVFYLDLPVILISHLTGIHADIVFVAYVFVLIASCCAFVGNLINGSSDSILEQQIFLLAVLAALILFGSWEFGQREHLAIILGLPYLCLIAQRAFGGTTDKWFAAIIGILAGLAFSLKPQFLAVPAVLEFYLALQLGFSWTLRRPEIFLLGTFSFSYVGSILLLTPEYISNVVPKALLVYSRGYSVPLRFVLLTWQTLVLPVVVAAHLLSRRRQRRPQFADVFLIAACIFCVIYISEMKGFSYQIMPVTVLIFLAMTAAMITGGRPAFGNITLCALLALYVYRGTYRDTAAQALAPVVQDRLHGGAIFAFTSYVWLGFPLANMVRARWSSRFPALWMLPGAEKGLRYAGSTGHRQLAAAYSKIEKYTIDSVVADLRKDPPTLIIVDKRPDPRFGEIEFNYVPFFSKDPRFAEIWSQYIWVARIESKNVGPYDIYARRSVSNPDANHSFSKLVPSQPIR
jgi:hypothetical protein